MERSTTEWAVLGVVAEEPTHGFAVARLLRADGSLGRIWTVSKPLVYRAVTTLADAGAIAPSGEEPSESGPRRQTFAVTAPGRRQLERWLRTAVPHVRDLRSELLLKLAFLDRAGDSPVPLLTAQGNVLDATVRELRAQARQADGFDRTLLSWRATSAGAAKQFVERARREVERRP